MFNEKNEHDIQDFSEILDKLLEYEKSKKKNSPIKIIVSVILGICSIIFLIWILYTISKTGFSIESVLSTLLAFFSIFISIFFYFKADETSTNFYNSSYDFMKDISVTLGKIEERFGEKLNSLNDKVTHLDMVSSETSKEIRDKKVDKDSIINDLMDKANLNEEEKKQFRKQLEEKDAEIELLRQHKYAAERDAERLKRQILDMKSERIDDALIPPRGILERLLQSRDISFLSIGARNNLRRLGIINTDGEINDSVIINLLNKYVS